MPETTRYYAVVGPGRSVDDPSGVARRRLADGGTVDESLARDLTWKFTDALYQDERGENFGPELVEISAERAEQLIDGFREKWGGGA